MFAREVESLINGGSPQPSHNRELFFKSIKTFAKRGEGDSITGVFIVKPTSSKTQFDTTI